MEDLLCHSLTGEGLFQPPHEEIPREPHGNDIIRDFGYTKKRLVRCMRVADRRKYSIRRASKMHHGPSNHSLVIALLSQKF